MSSESTYELFATCPKGLELLLAEELTTFGAINARETLAGVTFAGTLAVAYRACLWSRLANKVLLPIAKVAAESSDALYEGVRAIDWSAHLKPTGTLWIDFSGTDEEIRNTQYGAQRVKDGIVDSLRNSAGDRPSIQKHRPDLTVTVRLSRQQAIINIDLVGESLHRRGYRVESVVAPMKENLAAALLLRCQWPKLSEAGAAFIDPMCGSGTLLIEAAMIATDTAPNLARSEFAFMQWPQHDNQLWKILADEALDRQQTGLNKPLEEIRGYDESGRAIRASEENILAAGFDEYIKVICKPLSEFKRPTHKPLTHGLLLTNPPYGERLGEQEFLRPLYRQLGDIFKSDFQGWQAGVFTANIELAKNMGLRSHKKYKLFNGAIPSELLLFDIKPEYFVDHSRMSSGDGGDVEVILSDGAQMVANRLKKNRKQLEKWAKKSGVDCYRLYDADLPEYAAAIDLYGDQIHVQEYAAPKTIDPEKAEKRFAEIVQAVKHELKGNDTNLSIKQRKRNKGKEQYERLSDDPFDNQFLVTEGQAKFWVDTRSYLDTGVFLDHRLVRSLVAERAKGKRLLNLFCYTSTLTVQAALAGAQSSVSVDMSKTYLSWAQRNYVTNKLSRRHELVQEDCLHWLETCRDAFDLIVLDPPSFSNSKRMEGVLDIQRDHVALVERCMGLLNSDGTLIFSNNLRSFKLDYSALNQFKIEDVSAKTIDKDFQRNTKIHQCFLVTK